MWILIYIYIFCLSLLFSLALTPIARRFAERAGICDHPGERKPQARPVPLLGGIAIMGAFIAAILLNYAFLVLCGRFRLCAGLLPDSLLVHIPGALSVLPRLCVVILGGVIIFLIGLWDDIAEISARVKLLGQLLVALVLIGLDVRITLFVPNYILSCAVTIAWIVLVTNAFNLLDNMDGLCAGVALLVSSLFWAISAGQGHYFIAISLAAFSGTLLGFLRYNFHPAGIFMGDAGSMFIGYFIAVMTVMQTFYHPGGGPLAVFMPLVILAVPLYDTISVTVIRLSHGESIFKGDRRHFSHRLLKLGMSPKGTALFVYLVTLCTGLAALLLPWAGWGGGVIVFIQTILIISVIAVLEYFAGKKNSSPPGGGSNELRAMDHRVAGS